MHPFLPRKLPIIADEELVDMEYVYIVAVCVVYVWTNLHYRFGTGVVKVTPAHDPNDYLCGQRHQLENISIFTDDGRINENGGPFQGMMRYDARVAIEKALEEKGLFYGKEENPMRLAVSICLCLVWKLEMSFFSCVLGVAMLSSLCWNLSGMFVVQRWRWKQKIRLFPVNWKLFRNSINKLGFSKWKYKMWSWLDDGIVNSWLDNIRDWCVSRQLWWGHRIPAYQVFHNSSGSMCWLLLCECFTENI